MQASVRLSLVLLLAAAPAALPALPTDDLKIEDAVLDSYNFRVVLDRHVKVAVHNGQVTLTGSVADAEASALAQDTVENLPAVTGVTNEISIVPRYTVGSDSWLAGRIRRHLQVRARVSAFTTIVSVQDGVATLGGTAASLAQKELAGVYAAEIDRVQSVRNNIVVKNEPAVAEKIDDASITTQVKYALLGHKSTRALKTRITTLEGVVHITGEAASAAEKSLVSQLALDVRGTATVTNDMTVKG